MYTLRISKLLLILTFTANNAFAAATRSEALSEVDQLYTAIVNSNLEDYDNVVSSIRKLKNNLDGGGSDGRFLTCTYRDLSGSSHDGYFIQDVDKGTYVGNSGSNLEGCNNILRNTKNRFTCGYLDLSGSSHDGYFVHDLEKDTSIGNNGTSLEACVQILQESNRRFTCAYRDLSGSSNDGFFVYDANKDTYLGSRGSGLEECLSSIPR